MLVAVFPVSFPPISLPHPSSIPTPNLLLISIHKMADLPLVSTKQAYQVAVRLNTSPGVKAGLGDPSMNSRTPKACKRVRDSSCSHC